MIPSFSLFNITLSLTTDMSLMLIASLYYQVGEAVTQIQFVHKVNNVTGPADDSAAVSVR